MPEPGGSTPSSGMFREIVQWTERRVSTPDAGGSNPPLATMMGLRQDLYRLETAVYTGTESTVSPLNRLRGVAQLVARLPWEQDVAGSNPVTPTINLEAE